MEFVEGQVVKYKGFNEVALKYTITRVWDHGFGYFDLYITDEDKDYDGHFYEEYHSIPYSELRDENSPVTN